MADSTYRATISKITGEGIFVVVPKLGVGVQYGPCQYARPILDILEASTHEHGIQTVWEVGQQVVVTTINGIPEDLIILGVLG